jgi:hypothetical protein
MEEEFVNAERGIDMVPTRNKETWWNHHRFPLVPMWSYEKGDHWNTRRWSFTWLGLRYWSLDHVSFSIELKFDGSGLAADVILPYIRLWLWVLPLPLNRAFDRIRRKSASEA